MTLPPAEPEASPDQGGSPIDERLYIVLAVTVAAFLIGITTQSPLVVFLAGASVIAALVLIAVMSPNLSTGARSGIAVGAAVLAIAGIYGFFLWWASLMRWTSTYGSTCGAFIALPAMGLLGILFASRPYLMARWGLRPT